MIALFSALILANSAPHGIALVVTNNRSHDTKRPDLQYADDDGVAYAALFADSLGETNVILLTDPDPATRALHPDWSARAQSPTRANVLAAVREITRRLAATGSARGDAIVYLVLAGHGDVKDGAGYVELADGVLDTQSLDAEVLAPLTAAQVHLIADSCNSYFLLSPRKAGGRRFQAEAAPKSLLEKYPKLGVLVSTSAEAVTYEWSEIQSGVFSYELRSGLRGAADADGDGTVSYRELEVFVNIANSGIVNEEFRPHIFARPPDKAPEQALWHLSDTPRTLVIADNTQHRLTVRDKNGVRLADLHNEAGTGVRLRLPGGAGLTVDEVVPMENGTRLRQAAFDGAGVVDYAALSESPTTVAQRGEAPVFAALFEQPFGKDTVAAAAAIPSQNVTSFGVTHRDFEHLERHLRLVTELDRGERLAKGLGMLVGAGLAATPGIVLASEGRFAPRERIFAVAVPAAVVVGIVLGTVVAEASLWSGDLAEEVTQAATEHLTTGADRLLDLRNKFSDKVQSERTSRNTSGWLATLAGATIVGVSLGLLYDRTPDQPDIRSSLWLLAADGAALTLVGVLNFFVDTPAERAWELYEAGESPFMKPEEPAASDAASVSLRPVLGPTAGGVVLGLGGSF